MSQTSPLVFNWSTIGSFFYFFILGSTLVTCLRCWIQWCVSKKYSSTIFLGIFLFHVFDFPHLPGKTTISTNFLIQPKFNSLGITYNIAIHSPPMVLKMTFIALSQSTKMLSRLSNKTAGCTYTVWYAKGLRISTGCLKEGRSQGPWQMYGEYFAQNSTWYMMMAEYSTSLIHTISYILYHTPWTTAGYIRG